MNRLIAALAAALLTCVPAAAQNVATLPLAQPLAGSERIPAQQGTGCPAKVQPCATVAVTPALLATYLTGTFQAKDGDLDAIAALATTDFGRQLLTKSDAAALRSYAGAAASGVNTDIASIQGSAARLTTARAINGISFDGSANITINAVDSTARLAASSNLADLASAATARTNLGVSATGADPAFAKLSGAAFTGGITGTTATFSGIITVVANGSYFGPSTASSGNGGNIRYRDDTGTARWLTGMLGSAGATNYSIYNLASSTEVLQIAANGNVTTPGAMTAARHCYSATVCDYAGSGAPAVAAAVGSTYRRTDGGAATTFYVKESGAGTTGWVAK